MKHLRGYESLVPLHVIFICLLQACSTPMTKGPPERPIRKYVSISRGDLYNTVASVFRDHGYEIEQQTPEDGRFETAWKKKRERRPWRADIDRRRKYKVKLEKHYTLSGVIKMRLKEAVQEKAIRPTSSWKLPDHEESNDPQYSLILKDIDNAVLRRGGQIYTGENYDQR